MKTNWWSLLIVVVALCGFAVAQSQLDPGRGMAGAGSMSWTGTLQSIDAATHTLTLVRDKKGKQETFNCLMSSEAKFFDANGKILESRGLNVGEKAKVYYQPMRTKEGERRNVVTRIDLMDRK